MVSGTICVDEEKMYMQAMHGTTIQWTEDEILGTLAEDKTSSVSTIEWVRIMMAGALGSVAAAKSKYPELYI